ncbi:hypothetical protein RLOatenuis_3270 [Rickettsiales bacterium]|nr:hypothetical protein RLOatenuis_3270 [Rickettsiales bacterium]
MIIVNTPALTTATACKNALTGLGAAIALGSQLCIGIRAALPAPYAKSSSKNVDLAGDIWGNIPPSTKSSVPARLNVKTIARKKNNREDPNNINKYILPALLASLDFLNVTKGYVVMVRNS